MNDELRQDRISMILGYLLQGKYDGPDARRAREVLDGYSDTLILRLRDISASQSVPRTTLAMVISDRRSENALSQSVWFLAKVTAIKMYVSYSDVSVIDGLHRYRQLPRHTDYSYASKQVREACLALVRVALAIHDFASPLIATPPLDGIHDTERFERWISDDRLVDLLIKEPEQADRIVSLIKNNQRGDYGFIAAALAGDNTSLVDCIL